MKAVIMAGGKGTRLQSVAKDIPKPMFPIGDKPILEYQIESLKRSGITEIIIIVGYLGDVIKDFFSDGSSFGVNIEYITEDIPLGTAGALYFLRGKISEDFFLIFGDLILDVDWKRFMDFHVASGGDITLFAHPNSHPYDSDVIVADDCDRVLRIEPKNIERDFFYRNCVNAGVYCLSNRILNKIEAPKKIDLEKEIIRTAIEEGSVYAYRSSEYVKDMGTPDRLEAVTHDVESGLLNKRSLKNKQRAIFLDRDGTINVYRGLINKAEDFELLPNVSEAVRLINESGYLAIVVTNQPVIARGECTFEELSKMHMKLETLLGKDGAYIDDLYFCPHHPDSGYKGEIPELKIKCDCRKPKTGMLLKAAEKFNINLKLSWMIGDTSRDVMTGVNAGMKTVLVNTGDNSLAGGFEVVPTVETSDILEAVRFILESEK